MKEIERLSEKPLDTTSGQIRLRYKLNEVIEALNAIIRQREYPIKVFGNDSLRSHTPAKGIGFLRQLLNEDRITDPKKMVTNEQIEKWLGKPASSNTPDDKLDQDWFSVNSLYEFVAEFTNDGEKENDAWEFVNWLKGKIPKETKPTENRYYNPECELCQINFVSPETGPHIHCAVSGTKETKPTENTAEERAFEKLGFNVADQHKWRKEMEDEPPVSEPSGELSPEKRKKVISEFEEVINRNSLENLASRPDYILAEYLLNCLIAYDSPAVTEERSDECSAILEEFEKKFSVVIKNQQVQDRAMETAKSFIQSALADQKAQIRKEIFNIPEEIVHTDDILSLPSLKEEK